MKRTIYEVSPKGERWAVKRRGATRATRVFDRKAEAVALAREIAKRSRSLGRDSQVVIQREDGTIQTEHTYGHDPHPPLG
jgi:hypothetical protein